MKLKLILQDTNRMTLMFCSFEGGPLIVRLYGTARSIRPENENWNEMISLFPNQARARQIFEMEVVDVQTSCGYGVPFFKFESQRNRYPFQRLGSSNVAICFSRLSNL